jgi:type II secretion system (T2SS) protein G
MFELRKAILEHGVTSGDVPSDLSGFLGNNQMLDGWSNQMILQKDDNVITITSLGRDHRKGGNGEDADIIASFELRESGGRWANPNENVWIVDPADSSNKTPRITIRGR